MSRENSSTDSLQKATKSYKQIIEKLWKKYKKLKNSFYVGCRPKQLQANINKLKIERQRQQEHLYTSDY